MKNFKIKLITTILTISSQLSFGQVEFTIPKAKIAKIENKTDQTFTLHVGDKLFPLPPEESQENINLPMKVLSTYRQAVKYSLAQEIKIFNFTSKETYRLFFIVDKYPDKQLFPDAVLARAITITIPEYYRPDHRKKEVPSTQAFKQDRKSLKTSSNNYQDYHDITLILEGAKLKNSKISVHTQIKEIK
ncbi:MAG: hypothetical protein WDZ41_04775 [Candidatus Babeliales bacterium]